MITTRTQANLNCDKIKVAWFLEINFVIKTNKISIEEDKVI